MQAEDWLKEKKLLREVLGEFGVDAVWHENTVEKNSETRYHKIHTYRKGRSTVITVTPMTDEELRERGR